MEAAETRYLQRDTGLLAYQVFGSGADVVWLGEIVQHLDLSWTEPHVHALFERISASCRMAFFQVRGLGLSDPLPAPPSLEEQADDVLAVMDAVGMADAVFVTTFTTSGAAALVAARAPERVRGIVMVSPLAQGSGASDSVGWGGDEQRQVFVDGWTEVFDNWGSGLTASMWHPSWGTAYNRRLFALLERCSASPATAAGYYQWALTFDHREVLRRAQVPVRVLFPQGGAMPEAAVRHVAELLPRGTFHVLPPVPFGASIGEYFLPVFEHLQEMATGSPALELGVRLGALLFTDVVASTEVLARLGDSAYAELRATHERQVRVAVERFGGEIGNVAGDGTLSVFDGTARAVECGLSVLAEAEALGLPVRAGVHSGELDQSHLSLTGMAVHVAARVMAAAGPCELLVTRAARDLAADDPDLAFVPRGTVPLKGVPGVWELWSATAAEGSAAMAERPTPTPLDRAVVQASRRAPGLSRAAVRLGAALQRRLVRSG